MKDNTPTTAERLRQVVAEISGGTPAPDARAAAEAILKGLSATERTQLAAALVAEMAATPRPLQEMAPAELREYRNRVLPGWALSHLKGLSR